MTPRLLSTFLALSLLISFVAVQPALAAPTPPQAAATLAVNFYFSPSTVGVNSPTQISVSISGGSPPYWLWFNASIPGCSPANPIQQTSSSGSYQCTPSATGSFPAHLDVADNAGDHGSASTTLNVQSTGGNTGGTGGNGTGNNTGGFNLSGLTDMLGVILMIVIVFLACTVAIAASAVALAILVPRRLKQIRKAIEGQPMKKPKSKAEAPKPEPAPPEAPKDEMPKDEL